jgi:hypothetical protein
MYVVGQELDLLDAKNMRIVIMDSDLNIQKYIKIRDTTHGLLRIGRFFYMLRADSESPFLKVAVYDEQGNILKQFSDHRPSYVDKNPTTRMEMAVMKIFTGLNFQFNKDSGEIVVVPQNPGDTIEIFLYSPEGKLIRKLDINHIIRYHFPFKWELPIKYPEHGNWVHISSIHCIAASKVLLEYSIVSYNGAKAEKTQTYLLVVDTSAGKLVHKEMIEPTMNIMDVKGKTICARTVEGDINKVVICEFEYK